MMGFPIILLTIIIGLILIGVLVVFLVWKRRSELKITNEPDYRTFFIMGIGFLPMGIILTITTSPGFIGFIGLGLVYMAIGLTNRDKWKK